MSFIDPQKNWPETVGEFLTTLMLLTLSRQWLCVYARQCSITPRKSDSTVSTREQTRLHSCWWLGAVFSRSQSLGLAHLRYPAGFGVRRPTTSVCKSTGPQRGYHKRMERGLPRDSSNSYCTMEKTIECSQRADCWRDSAHFRQFLWLLRNFMYFDALD